MKHLPTILAGVAILIGTSPPKELIAAEPAQLIVVEDRGGISALPYYSVLDLQRSGTRTLPPIELPSRIIGGDFEEEMLPVRSSRLSPGQVHQRTIQAIGLTPIFLVGDDKHSHAWLRENAPRLREIKAMGLVVNVESMEALAALRRLAPGLMLSPAAGDDLAARLGLSAYPVLITATSISQ